MPKTSVHDKKHAPIHIPVMIPLPSISQLTELVKKGMTMEAQEQVIKLRETTLQLHEENLTLNQEARQLRDSIAVLEKKLKFRAKLKFKAPLYYLKGDETPDCPICGEKDQKAIHVIGPKTVDTGRVYARCNVCKKDFVLEEGQPLLPVTRMRRTSYWDRPLL